MSIGGKACTVYELGVYHKLIPKRKSLTKVKRDKYLEKISEKIHSFDPQATWIPAKCYIRWSNQGGQLSKEKMLFLSALPVRVNTGGKVCTRCLA